MPFTAATLSAAGVGMDMPEFPQILESNGEYLVAEDDTLYNIGAFSHVLGPTLTAISTKDPLVPANAKAIVSGGGRWDYVQIGLPTDKTQMVVVQNDKNLVFIHNLIHITNYLVFTTADGKIPRTVTYHKGRFIRGGWNSPFGSGSTFPTGWETIFEAWFVETRTDWGWSTDSGDHTQGPQPNWIFYSTPGEDDYIYHLLPDVMKNALDSTIDLSTGDTIYGLNLFTDPSFKEDPINGATARMASPVTDPWKWFQGFSQTFVDAASTLNNPLTFPAGPSVELAVIDPDTTVAGPDYVEIDPTKMLAVFVNGNTYHIELNYSFNLDVGLVIKALLGGTQIFSRTVTAGEANVRTDDQQFSGTVVCGGSNSATLGVITLEFGLLSGTITVPIDMLRLHSVIVREALTTPYNIVREQPETDYFILEQIRRNQAGFLLMPFGGEVLKIKPLLDHVMVYGEDGVALIQHHDDRGMALSYMGLGEEVWGSGCSNKEAVTGDMNQHFWVDSIGNLWTINSQLQSQRLGFREYIEKLMPSITGATTSNVIMSFDEFEKRVYISGVDIAGDFFTYVYDSIEDTFYEMNQKVSSVHNNANRLVGIVEDLSGFENIVVTSNTMDFGYRGLKELNPTEVNSELLKNGKLDVSFNTDTETRFLTGTLISNGFGVHYNRASGREFQFLFTADGYKDILKTSDFSASGDWTANGNWSIAAGVASHAGADTGNLVSKAANLSNVLVEDSVYLVEYDVIDTGANVRAVIGGTNGITRTTIGRHQELIIAGSGADIVLEVTTSYTGDIDNFRVMLTGGRLNSMKVHYDIVDNRFTMSPLNKEIAG